MGKHTSESKHDFILPFIGYVSSTGARACPEKQKIIWNNYQETTASDWSNMTIPTCHTTKTQYYTVPEPLLPW